MTLWPPQHMADSVYYDTQNKVHKNDRLLFVLCVANTSQYRDREGQFVIPVWLKPYSILKLKIAKIVTMPFTILKGILFFDVTNKPHLGPFNTHGVLTYFQKNDKINNKMCPFAQN